MIFWIFYPSFYPSSERILGGLGAINILITGTCTVFPTKSSLTAYPLPISKIPFFSLQVESTKYRMLFSIPKSLLYLTE